MKSHVDFSQNLPTGNDTFFNNFNITKLQLVKRPMNEQITSYNMYLTSFLYVLPIKKYYFLKLCNFTYHDL